MCNGALCRLYIQDLPKLPLCELRELAAAVFAYQCDHAAADMDVAALGLYWLGVSSSSWLVFRLISASSLFLSLPVIIYLLTLLFLQSTDLLAWLLSASRSPSYHVCSYWWNETQQSKATMLMLA